MRKSKPAISELLDTLQSEFSLHSVKKVEQEIEKLKHLCLDEEIIQKTLLDSKKNEQGVICCPFCFSSHIKKNGFNRQNKKVYNCKNEHCNCKNFTATTNSILFSTKKDASNWIKYLLSYLDKDSLSVCADTANISENTGFFWRHKINFFLNNYLNKLVLKDYVELDETVYSENNIGKSKTLKSPKKRGISNDKVNIATAIDTHGNVIIKSSVNGRISTKALLDVFQGFIQEGATVVSDSLRSYHKFMKEMNVDWIKIASGKSEEQGHTLEMVNHLHDGIKTFLGLFRGVSKRYLQGYLSYFNLFLNYRHHYHDSEFESILVDLFSVRGRLTYKDIINKDFIYV